ncbi:MAG: hypothetical protein QOF50_1536 [Gaiellaceae bacterium]|nr:hypothetical protein [Gaiellaceae bacterium]
MSIAIDPTATHGEEEAIACEVPLSRRSILRRATVLSAGLFAALGARGEKASGHAGQGSPACCNLARGDQWCAPTSGDPPFWCDHGGFKRVWYCNYFGYLWGCGECQKTTGTCFNGDTYYCSYAWIV